MLGISPIWSQYYVFSSRFGPRVLWIGSPCTMRKLTLVQVSLAGPVTMLLSLSVTALHTHSSSIFTGLHRPVVASDGLMDTEANAMNSGWITRVLLASSLRLYGGEKTIASHLNQEDASEHSALTLSPFTVWCGALVSRVQIINTVDDGRDRRLDIAITLTVRFPK